MTSPKGNAAADSASRMRGAIWGQFVGDAACLGAHWIYDFKMLSEIFPGGITGFETPHEGHYHAGKHSGDLTHYGDAALLMLQSVADAGHFEPSDFGARFVALFASEQYKGYRDHATNGTLDNYQAFAASHPDTPYPFQGGADDDQPATVTRLAPVVVAHYRDPQLMAMVQQATRVCQSHARAVAYAKCHALILKEIIAGTDVFSAFRDGARSMQREGLLGAEVATSIEGAFGAVRLEVREATLHFGQACPLASSFPAAAQCALKYPGDVQRAILETANAGGDNAARAALIGSWLGAANGIEGISREWRNRVNARREIDEYTEKLVQKAVYTQ